MRKFQRGMSMNALLMGGAAVFMLALLAMKVAPAWSEYAKIKNAVKITAIDPNLRDATVEQVRQAYDRRAQMDDIKEIKGVDLDVTKEGNDLLIEFAYTSKIPLFKNTSVVFDFEGSSAEQ